MHNVTLTLSKDNRDERLRAYHVRLDLMHSITHPGQEDFDWQVESITDWTTKDNKQIFVKVIWIGGDKQWISLDDMRLHDPHLMIKYALKNKLTNQPGWE